MVVKVINSNVQHITIGSEMKTQPNHIMGHHFKQMCLLIVVLALDICHGKSLQSQSDQSNNETIIEHLIDNPTNIQVWPLGRSNIFYFCILQSKKNYTFQFSEQGKQVYFEQTHSKRLHWLFLGPPCLLQHN